MQQQQLDGLAWHRERMARMRDRVGTPRITRAAMERSQQAAQARRQAARDAVDRELGDAGTVYLVSCAASKLDHAAPAQQLYTSPLFRKAAALAQASGQPWCILSAEHGLVDPQQVLEPYDKAVTDMDAVDRRAWAERVQRQLSARFLGRPRRYVVLAGSAYAQCVDGLPADFLLQGLQVGQRLRELNRLLAGA